MKTYYFVRSEDADEIAECGLKLLDGEYRPADICRDGKGICFVTKLNPADFREDHTGKTCIKIDLDKVNAYVAEGFFYDPFSEKGLDELYNNSVLPVKEYRLGMYRDPECLIINTVLPDCIEIGDPVMDEPILYTSSESLYLDRLFENAQNSCEDFRDLALEAYYDRIADSNAWQTEQIGFRKIYKDGKGNCMIALRNMCETESKE